MQGDIDPNLSPEYLATKARLEEVDRKHREKYRRSQPARSFSDMDCPSCRETFKLEWRSIKGVPWTLLIKEKIHGIVGVSIACPHCGYEEEI